jgi:hypothetical protein
MAASCRFIALVVAIVAFGVATREESSAVRSDTAAHVSRQYLPPAELPEGTVLRLWRLVQLGSYPLVLPLYDRRITDALGVDRIIGTLSLQREMALSHRPVVKSVERTRLGNLVSIEILSALRHQASQSHCCSRSLSGKGTTAG